MLGIRLFEILIPNFEDLKYPPYVHGRLVIFDQISAFVHEINTYRVSHHISLEPMQSILFFFNSVNGLLHIGDAKLKVVSGSLFVVSDFLDGKNFHKDQPFHLSFGGIESFRHFFKNR